MLANIICTQGGHYLTNQLLKKVFDDNQNFSILEIKEKYLPNSYINKIRLKSIA